MKKIEYNREKNLLLEKERGISFEAIKKAISRGKLLAIVSNPNQRRYPKQKLFILKINNYVYAVPFIEDEEKIFLKTAFPSRKYTKKYLKGKEFRYEK